MPLCVVGFECCFKFVLGGAAGLMGTPSRKFCANLKWLFALLRILGSCSGWLYIFRGPREMRLDAVSGAGWLWYGASKGTRPDVAKSSELMLETTSSYQPKSLNDEGSCA